tara:strand:- start:949 stop:2064 length:1116 start_codon:yes stop_codon:yes gene_type:complete
MTKLSIDDDFLNKSNEYNNEKLKVSIFASGLSLIITYLIIFATGMDLIRSLSESIPISFINNDLKIILVFYLVLTLINLPINYYKTFIVEQKFGFNKSTKNLFFKDFFISTILSLIIVMVLFKAFQIIYYASEDFWWLYIWVLFIFVNILTAYIFPTLIAPLFNKFKKLEGGDLSKSITDLVNDTGFPLDDLYVMDGSKRSSHSNAYFTGMFGKKRIVFFDTLLDILNTGEIKSVLAHEIGHYKEKHILQSTILLSFLSLALLYLFSMFINTILAQEALFTPVTTSYIAIIFMLLSPMILFFIMPLLSLFSRKNEYEADNFAKRYANSEDLISSLLKLYRGNLSLVKSSSIYSAFYYSHPSVFDRISNLER